MSTVAIIHTSTVAIIHITFSHHSIKCSHHSYQLYTSFTSTVVIIHWSSGLKCTIMCPFKELFTLKHFWHTLHWNGFSPVCIRRWRSSLHWDGNDLMQYVHFKSSLTEQSGKLATGNIKLITYISDTDFSTFVTLFIVCHGLWNSKL